MQFSRFFEAQKLSLSLPKFRVKREERTKLNYLIALNNHEKLPCKKHCKQLKALLVQISGLLLRAGKHS